MGKPWVVLLLLAGAAWADNATVYAPDEACAYFKIYQDEALTKEVGSPLGGVVYPVLYIRLGPGWRVHEDTNQLTVTVTDNYPDYEAGTNVVKTFSDIPMTVQGWETKLQDGTTWTSCAGPGHNVNGDPTKPVFYRYKLIWNSMKEPLGNNGKHTLAADAQVKFQSTTGQPVLKGPAAKVVTTENCWISDVRCWAGNLDYFLFEPDGAEALRAPRVDFRIHDADPRTYQWTVRFWQTAHTIGVPPDDARAITGFCSVGDAVSVDFTDLSYEQRLTEEDEPGPYCYDISIEKLVGQPPSLGGLSLDSYSLKAYVSHLRQLPPEEAYCLSLGDHGVVATVLDEEQIQLGAWYTLLHDKAVAAAEDVKMTAFDGSGSVLGSAPGPGAIGAMQGSETEPLPICLVPLWNCSPEWPVVWTGADPYGRSSPDRRLHDAPRMLAANVPGRNDRALCVGGGKWLGYPELPTSTITSLQGKYAKKGGFGWERVQGDANYRKATAPEYVVMLWIGYRSKRMRKEDYDVKLRAFAMDAWCHGSKSALWLRGDGPQNGVGVANESGFLNICNYEEFRGAGFAQLLGCNTGTDGSASLVNVVHQRGVRCVIGCDQYICVNGLIWKKWMELLYSRLTERSDQSDKRSRKYTISEAFAAAKSAMLAFLRGEPYRCAGDPKKHPPDGYFGWYNLRYHGFSSTRYRPGG